MLTHEYWGIYLRMLGLSSKQKDELNMAILEYLTKHDYHSAVKGLCEDTGL